MWVLYWYSIKQIVVVQKSFEMPIYKDNFPKWSKMELLHIKPLL